MTQFWRVYASRERRPRDYVGKVAAESAEDAIRQVQAQPASRGRYATLVAVPAHPPRKPGK